MLRARETAPDMKAAIDELVDKLVRQVGDLHDKRVAGRKHFDEPAVADRSKRRSPRPSGDLPAQAGDAERAAPARGGARPERVRHDRPGTGASTGAGVGATRQDARAGRRRRAAVADPHFRCLR